MKDESMKIQPFPLPVPPPAGTPAEYIKLYKEIKKEAEKINKKIERLNNEDPFDLSNEGVFIQDEDGNIINDNYKKKKESVASRVEKLKKSLLR